MTNSDAAVILAHVKGYYVNDLGEVFTPKGLKRKLKINSGYFKFTLRFNGKNTNVAVHRLAILQRFGEECLLDKELQVRHLNNNKLDNSLENLKPGTSLDNYLDNPEEENKNRLIKAGLESPKYTRKFSNEQIALMRAQYASGLSYNKLKIIWNIPKSSLSYILSDKAKKRAHY